MELNSYNLSREWFNFSFDNPEKIRAIHTAILFFAIEHCNRLGWKEKFGFPSQMAMDAIGVKNWHTYAKGLNELVDFGFIKMIQKSKNQYSSNVISLKVGTPKKREALDKALSKHATKHTTKQARSTPQSIDSINKQGTSKQGTRNKGTKEKGETSSLYLDSKELFIKHYLEQTKNQYYWDVKSAASLNPLLNKIKFSISEKKEKDTRQKETNATDNEVLTSFKYILQHLPQWYKDNLSIAILNSKYNEIINQLRNGQNSEHKRIDALKSGLAKIDAMYNK